MPASPPCSGRRDVERRVSALRGQLERVDSALVIERTIDGASYTNLRDRLREELALAELSLSDARTEQFDIEAVLAFAEHVMANTANLWMAASAADRRSLQAILFPEGLAWGGRGFGTVVPCRAFSYLRELSTDSSNLASPEGLTPFTVVGSVRLGARPGSSHMRDASQRRCTTVSCPGTPHTSVSDASKVEKSGEKRPTMLASRNWQTQRA